MPTLRDDVAAGLVISTYCNACLTAGRPGVLHDPRTPEILAWVDAMPIAERLTVDQRTAEARTAGLLTSRIR